MALITNPRLRGGAAPVVNPGESSNLIPQNGIIGLPPDNFVSSHVIENSMPIAQIMPFLPQYVKGLSLFTLGDAWGRYENIVKNLGFVPAKPIKVAFLADNFPTDTFTNEYGETFFQKMTDVASQGVRDIMQVTGSATVGEATGKAAEFMKELGTGIGGMTGGGFGWVGKQIGKAGAGMRRLEKSRSTAGLISRLLTGARVDMPNVWQNSGFSPSYTMTIRLYNPNPGSVEATKKYIIGPLAVLLALGVPQSDDGNTYRWPFFQKIKCPGIYNLDPAVITNISVIKGGDQQQIAQNQLLGMVDVRIDFVSLYNSMLVETGSKTIPNRPTLRSYLKTLAEPKDTKEHYLTASAASGVPVASLFYQRSEQIERRYPELINNMAAARSASTVSTDPLESRVSEEDEEDYEGLELDFPMM